MKTNYKKIELFLDGKYICTTTRARNLKVAKEAFLKSGYYKYAEASKLTARYEVK